MRKTRVKRTVTGLDQYFTPSKLSDKLVSIAKKYISPQMNIIEPAAGSGQIVKALNREGYADIICIELDKTLSKQHGFQCNDFLKWVPSNKCNNIVIGNPPFTIPGKRFAAILFLNHALLMAKYVVFILPMAMSCARHINRVNKHGHLIENIVFDSPQKFICGDEHRDGRICIQVWMYKNVMRTKPQKFLSQTPDFNISATRIKNIDIPSIDILFRNKGGVNVVAQLIFSKQHNEVEYEKEWLKIKSYDGARGIIDYCLNVTDRNKVLDVFKVLCERKQEFVKYLKYSTCSQHFINKNELISIYTNGADPYIHERTVIY